MDENMDQNMGQNMNQNMDENMINMIRMRMLSEHCSPATRRSSLGSSASATRIGVSSSRLFTHRLHVYNQISLKFVHFCNEILSYISITIVITLVGIREDGRRNVLLVVILLMKIIVLLYI